MPQPAENPRPLNSPDTNVISQQGYMNGVEHLVGVLRAYGHYPPDQFVEAYENVIRFETARLAAIASGFPGYSTGFIFRQEEDVATTFVAIGRGPAIADMQAEVDALTSEHNDRIQHDPVAGQEAQEFFRRCMEYVTRHNPNNGN